MRLASHCRRRLSLSSPDCGLYSRSSTPRAGCDECSACLVCGAASEAIAFSITLSCSACSCNDGSRHDSGFLCLGGGNGLCVGGNSCLLIFSKARARAAALSFGLSCRDTLGAPRLLARKPADVLVMCTGAHGLCAVHPTGDRLHTASIWLGQLRRARSTVQAKRLRSPSRDGFT